MSCLGGVFTDDLDKDVDSLRSDPKDADPKDIIVPAWTWDKGSCSLDSTAMMALVVIVNYLNECKEIADSSDLPFRALFHAYADIGKWEPWRPRKMTAIRDRIRAIFVQRDVNPVRITGSKAIDETLPSLVPEELRALRLQTFATCGRKKCPKLVQFNADIHENGLPQVSDNLAHQR
jgi:hypothetical protein